MKKILVIFNVLFLYILGPHFTFRPGSPIPGDGIDHGGFGAIYVGSVGLAEGFERLGSLIWRIRSGALHD